MRTKHGVIKEGNRFFLTATLIRSNFDSVLPDFEFTLVMSPEPVSLGRAKDGSSTKGLLVYLERLNLGIEESNLAEITELFHLLHPWKDIIESANHLCPPDFYVRREKKEQIPVYLDVIRPPLCKVEKDIHKIILWAIDRLSGDLEQWEIYENSQKEKQIRREIVEESLICTLS